MQTLGTSSGGDLTSVSAKKSQKNKKQNKIGGDPQPLSVGDPQSISAGRSHQNKNWNKKQNKLVEKNL